MSDIFVRETDSEYNFVCNRENGKWALLKRDFSGDFEDVLDSAPIEGVLFSGTDTVLLNVGTGCNLDCLYCHLGKDKTGVQMPLETGRKALDRVMELPESDREVIFHGGEPLVYYPLIKELVKYGKGLGIRRFGLQTNGTLLSDEMLDFFHENNVGIGVSLDGLREHQDVTRRDAKGGGTYESVRRNIHKIVDRSGGVSVISVVSCYNVSDLEDITKGFSDMGVSSVRFSPVYPTSYLGISPDINEFSGNLISVFDDYLNRLMNGDRGIRILNLQGLVRTLFREKKTFNCAKCGNGDRQPLVAVDIDGSIYPCDFFWGREEYKMGHIDEDMLMDAINSHKNMRHYRDIGSLEDCLECNWKLFCGAGCPGSSVISGRGLVQRDPYCQFNKDMLEYAVSKLPVIYNNGILRDVLGEPKT